MRDLDSYVDNIFDPNRIDDSTGMQQYYDEDHFLAVLKQQRDKLILDLSSELNLYKDEYGENSSIVKNQENIIAAELANHNSKINRRKKQIEIAVMGPKIYGGKSSAIFSPGEVPINDFSYLADYNVQVDLEKQKALTFRQADVNGIVLPINSKFVKSPPKPDSVNFQHLNIPMVGKGSIIYSPSSTIAGTVLSLTDQIVTDKLFAIYNFLETEVVLPSSIEFKTTNCASNKNYNNSQLVAANKTAVFFSGLGIPYFEGIVKNKSSDPAGASALGSFLKLPDTTEFRDLTYSPSGFTIECWVHVPNITDAETGWLSSTTSSLTKVLLGCENVGAKENSIPVDKDGNLLDLDLLQNSKGDQYVRGLVCGFTRDRRITQENKNYSNLNEDNNPTSSLSFFIAPTISRDLSSASFINNNSEDCYEKTTFHKMKVDLSSTGFGNVSSQFVLIDIACNIDENTVKMFADGDLVATSALSDVFGVPAYTPANLPTFKKENSFEYSDTTVDGPTSLKGGPKLNTFYTPWIVGGGYTDGMYQYGNFLGGDRSGIISGLRGHVGSLKFYAKPLDNNEVQINYKAQKGFFKNILI